MRNVRAAAAAAVLVSAAATCGPSGGGGRGPAGWTNATRAAVGEAPLARDVPRLGVNLGTWTYWGAEQLSSNVVKNPGLEGVVDRTLLHVARASATRIADDDKGAGRPDGFFAGARVDVRSGAAIGTTGTVVASRQKADDGYPEISIADPIPGLLPGDAVAVTRVSDTEPPTNWWIPAGSAGRVLASPEARPGSPGSRSCLMDARSARAELISFLDSVGDPPGKMLPVNGPWRLSFWVKGVDAGVRLLAGFRRGSAPSFVERRLTPGSSWQEVVLDFDGKDDVPYATLELHLEAEAGRLLVDDVSLGPRDADGPFRREVVETLAALRPGTLRDWQGQLGDTLENRRAGTFARRGTRYRPGDRPVEFCFSLPDFLALCRKVGARPWVILSPGLSDEEWRQAGTYLAAEAAGSFPEVLVELGNENWNPTFSPGSIPSTTAYRDAIERARRLLAEGAGSAPVRLVANGPQGDWVKALAYGSGLGPGGSIGVAPYVFYRLAAGLPPAERVRQMLEADNGLFVRQAREVKAAGQGLVATEVNLHTLYGTAPPEERDPVVTGAASGPALARRLLAGMNAGVVTQCVWSLSGFATNLVERAGLVRLFGITRDLTRPGWLRPTGLAVKVLNQAIGGDLHPVTADGAPAWLSAAAWHGARGWSAAVVSTSDAPQAVELTFPAGGSLPVRLLVLGGGDPLATNETVENVTVTESVLPSVPGRTLRLSLPPRALVAAVPAGGAA